MKIVNHKPSPCFKKTDAKFCSHISKCAGELSENSIYQLGSDLQDIYTRISQC
jgi:hypothetical protein